MSRRCGGRPTASRFIRSWPEGRWPRCGRLHRSPRFRSIGPGSARVAMCRLPCMKCAAATTRRRRDDHLDPVGQFPAPGQWRSGDVTAGSSVTGPRCTCCCGALPQKAVSPPITSAEAATAPANGRTHHCHWLRGSLIVHSHHRTGVCGIGVDIAVLRGRPIRAPAGSTRSQPRAESAPQRGVGIGAGCVACAGWGGSAIFDMSHRPCLGYPRDAGGGRFLECEDSSI